MALGWGLRKVLSTGRSHRSQNGARGQQLGVLELGQLACQDGEDQCGWSGELKGEGTKAAVCAGAIVGTLAFTLLALEATRGLGLWELSDLTGLLWLLG